MKHFNDGNILYWWVKPPLHGAATFVPPLSDRKWLGRSVVAQTQKVLLLCNYCNTTLVPSLNNQSCCSGQTGHSKEAKWRQGHCRVGSRVGVAEWRHSGRQSDRSMDAIGRPKEAQWWHKEGRSVAEIWYAMFTTVSIFTERPMADHCASILRPRRCVCLPPASFQRPVSDRHHQRPLCDCFEHA